MKQTLRVRPTSGLLLAGLAASLTLVPGCNDSSDDETVAFVTEGTKRAVAAATPVVVRGTLLVYLGSETLSGPGGTVLNGDGDMLDDCAVVVDMVTGTEKELHVATTDVKLVGDNVYLIVSEAADNQDWSGTNGTADTVLLHFSDSSPLSFVAVIAPGTQSWQAAGGRLYFVRGDTTGLVAGETSIAFLTGGNPTTPVTVSSTDTGNTLFPEFLAVDEGLLFLTASEITENRDLNGDGDNTDPFVLALLDGTDVAGLVQVVELSVSGASSPVRARSRGPSDWLVGFLVDEATQSDFPTGLNDPTLFTSAWKPTNCAGYSDTDTTDEVLHFLDFSSWSANPTTNPPENTGVPGSSRVLATADAVATLAIETEDGGCDLNNDGDTSDTVLRWVLESDPQLPFGQASQLNAVDTTLPGGASSVTELSNRFLSVVDEADDNTDHDADGQETHSLVAWLDPTIGAPIWHFDHGDGAGLQAVGASSFADRRERDRVLVAFQEAVANLSINTGDTDKTDSVPTFAQFDPSAQGDLDFPGPAVAVVANNPGIDLGGGFAFYRVSEADDNRDWNGDNVKDDVVVFRTSLSSNFSSLLGNGARSTANNLSGPAVITSGDLGGAFLADEGMAGTDLNQPPDNRVAGFVVTWFRILQ